MTIHKNFEPIRGANQVTTPAAVAASVNLTRKSKSVRLVNTGGNICHVRIGEGAQTATTADMPVAAGTEIIVSKAETDEILSHISAGGTTLHVQEGHAGT